MSTCPACGASLEGQWKFCLRCGAPLQRDAPIAPTTPTADAAAAPPATAAHPAPAPVTVDVAPEPLPGDGIPAAIRPAAAPDAVAPLSTLAIVALALGIIGGPVAIIFGHAALRQIRQTGDRGRTAALVATVLGYVWLVAWTGVIVWVLVTGGR